jgi:serralysin
VATFTGTNASDSLIGSHGFQVIFGLGGDDDLDSDSSLPNAEIYGGDGNDNLDLLSGGGGNGAGLLDGGAGDDILDGSNFGDVLFGGSGNDAINSVAQGSANDYVDGGDGDDNINAGGVIFGGAGNDTISGNVGADNIFGGAGSDTINAGSADDNVSGGGGDDMLGGGSGNDDLFGGDGNDLLFADGNDGTDRLFGDAGIDTVTFFSLAAASVNLATGAVAGSATGDTFDGIENLTGGAGMDVFTGNDSANTFTGGGNTDTLDGSNGIDTVSYAEKVSFVNVTLNGSTFVFVSVGGVGEDAIANFENVIGGQASDTITGDGFDNKLWGGFNIDALNGAGGSDTLDGGQGADAMTGGTGDDTFMVENSGDTVSEANGGGSDRVIVTVGGNYTLQAGSYVELLRTSGSTSTYNVNLHGNNLMNTVQGNNGANVLSGGLRDDILTGFGGADKFRFNSVLSSSNIDEITDYNVAADTIQIDNSVFAGLSAGTLSAARFHIGSAAADSNDRIIYNSATGALIFDSNGSASGGAKQFATLDTGLALTNADIVVI